jgi:hypothetical protein
MGYRPLEISSIMSPVLLKIAVFMVIVSLSPEGNVYATVMIRNPVSALNSGIASVRVSLGNHVLNAIFIPRLTTSAAVSCGSNKESPTELPKLGLNSRSPN